MEAEELLEGLDLEQQTAVTAQGGPLRILAGPGSGKTRVLTTRIAHRAVGGSLDVRHVVAVTFTRRAAQELRSRLRRLRIGELAAVGTFHAIAFGQLRRYYLDADRRPPAVVQRRGLLGRTIDDRLVSVLAAAAEIDWAKSCGLNPQGYESAVTSGARRPPAPAEAYVDAFRQYETARRKARVVDFDDLLTDVATAINDDADFAAAQRWRFRHLFIDEFQDVNPIQFALVRAWLGDSTDLCVVGDADQAIYGWNGADASYLSGLERWFPATVTVDLATNHRSAPEIVQAASRVLERAAARTVRPAGTAATTCTGYDDEAAEAASLARRIRDGRPAGGTWSRFAALVRTNAQLEPITEALRALDVPFAVRGQRIDDEAKTALEGLYDTDDLQAAIAEDDLPVRVVQLVAEYLRFDARPTGRGLRSWVATVRPADLQIERDAVTLATFHAAKGLEWPVVFVAGVEDGLLPIEYSRNAATKAEERRLLYVAMTRASHELHLTWAHQRDGAERSLSPFVDETWFGLEAQGHTDVSVSLETTPLIPKETGKTTRRALLEWRLKRARAAMVEPAAILSDASVADLARDPPSDLDDLARRAGLGAIRAETLGAELLQVLRQRP